MDKDSKYSQVSSHCQQLLRCHRHHHTGPPSCDTCCCAAALEGVRLCIRSTQDRELQDEVWDTPEFIDPILACHKYLYDLPPIDQIVENTSKLKVVDNSLITSSSPPSETKKSCESNSKCNCNSNDSNDVQQRNESNHDHICNNCHIQEERTEFLNEDLARGWAMCIANLVTGNSRAVQQLCQRLGASTIIQVLMASPPRVAQVWCAVLQCCVMSEDSRQLLFRTEAMPAVVARLCSLYCQELSHAFLARHCLEVLVCQHHCEEGLLQCWQTLGGLHRALLLTIIGEVAKGGHGRPVTLGSPATALLVRVYKEEVGKVLSNEEKQLKECQTQVLREACNAMLFVAASTSGREFLQGQDSLLDVSIYFLKALNCATFGPATEAGPGRANGWTKRYLVPTGDGRQSGTDDTASAVACVGLRCDVVQLIGNLVHECQRNQQTLRELGGLEEVFFSCRRDDNNPLIQEAVIFAMGCSVRDCPSNAQHLRSVLHTGKSDKDCPVMKRLGLVSDQFIQMPLTK